MADHGVMRIEPATRTLWPAVEDLFGRNGASNGCWCMYWILGPEYHKRPRQLNKQQLRSATSREHPPGILALDDAGVALGWCRLSPRDELPWLDSRPALSTGDDLAVWSLPCFYVRRGHRGQHIMTALIHGAVDYARTAGAAALEAYPVDTDVEGATSNLFPGTARAFAAAGFTEVARRTADRPVMRRVLAR
jgi:GNAT superfamily N-acetyltransferase